ncbi:InlB B-repeat-containing protein, partial [Candidatus Saccharibacteria bacterium]|nr:InlB B-repeat-containing protein [Candidatus Saccharibacteria bacterium]
GNNGNIINPRIVIAGLSTILPTSGFTKDGYGIKGWAFKSGVTPSTANTSADTTMYNAGQSVAINDLLTAALNAGQNPSTNNSFTVYAVWETAYTINFNKNSNEAIGSMNPDTPIIQSATYTIPTATFTREGYNFIGWALSSSAATAGTVAYIAGQTPTVSSLITAAQAAGQTVTPNTPGTITLYAVWEEATVWMQGFDCDARLPNIGDSTTAVDRRDNTTYNIKKLADGKCWMTENLILGYDAVKPLTNENTNIPDNDNSTYYLPKAGTRGNFNSATSTGPSTFDSNNDNQAQVQYRAQGSSGDQPSSGTLGQSTGYYNFYTATLGCSYYQDGLSSGQCASGYIQKDICPKGWHLPTGGAGGQFAALDIALNPDDASAGTSRSNTTSRDRFLNQAAFLYSGRYLSSQLYGVGSIGYWWSSTVSDTYNGYNLSLNSNGDVNPRDYSGKCNGFAIRCMAD